MQILAEFFQIDSIVTQVVVPLRRGCTCRVFEDILFAVLARVSEAIEEDLVARYAPLKSQQQEYEHQHQQQPGSDIAQVILVLMLNSSMNSNINKINNINNINNINKININN